MAEKSYNNDVPEDTYLEETPQYTEIKDSDVIDLDETVKQNERPQNSKIKEIFLFLKDLLIIFIIVMIIKTFLIVPFVVNGQSMYSSYYDKEFIVVDIFSYLVWGPERGDVIVFKPHVNNNKEFFLKRIIGMPGDNLKIEDGNVYIQVQGKGDFIKLDETYLNEENKGKTFVGSEGRNKIYKLGTDEYFVMGDNRNHSTDSRECFGNCLDRDEFVVRADMVGKVLIDLGYFDFRKFRFVHPQLGIGTVPRFFGSHSTHSYENLPAIN